MYTHTDMYIHTHIHTQKHVHKHRYMYIHRNTHAQTHVHTYTDTCTYIHRHMYMHTQTHTIKSCSTSLFTHRAGYCTLGGGREHNTQSFLCFHCAQLLNSLTASSANDRSGLSSEPAQQDGPGGHTCPHHNFHSPLASRRVEISSLGIV
ncbi:unnamed protein product, partial [Staurois parvus]